MSGLVHEPRSCRVVLSAAECGRREAAHRGRVGSFADAFRRRRSLGETHPVWDFLFTYYSFSPGKLATWMPAAGEGCGVELGEASRTFEFPPFTARGVAEARWIARLCGRILERPCRFVCHGLHEWAMVYRSEPGQVRHSACRLRLPPEELAEFVESQALCCSHYDAYRFFTPEARPRNALVPEFGTRLEMEQGGCLHANMDLYKWSYKLWPWVGSELVADAFQVAIAGRELDMRASPYDLAALGFAPVRVETGEGRAEYRREQERIALLAEPVRVRLLEAAERLAGGVGV